MFLVDEYPNGNAFSRARPGGSTLSRFSSGSLNRHRRRGCDLVVASSANDSSQKPHARLSASLEDGQSSRASPSLEPRQCRADASQRVAHGGGVV